jgi:hypothetical protein
MDYIIIAMTTITTITKPLVTPFLIKLIDSKKELFTKLVFIVSFPFVILHFD